MLQMNIKQCTHLIHIVSGDDVIKDGVETVEEADDLDGRALGTDLGEA